MSRRRSITICVKVPSPDHPVASTSDGMVDRHQPAEHWIHVHLRKPTPFEQPRDTFSAGVAPNGRGNVPVRVRIAVEDPAKRGADDVEICKVGGTKHCA